MSRWSRGSARAAYLLVLVAGATASGQSYPGHWAGRWIWTEGDSHPFHFFLMARREFTIPSAPRAARLVITAADRYLLYINGQYAGRGPARSDPRWTSYDTYDAGPRLRPGKNVIAVLAYYYGCPNAYTRDARAGLFAQIDFVNANGTKTALGTGGQWKVHHAKAWSQDVDPINSSVGVTEVYDANADPTNWMSPDFDDSGWPQAYVIPERESPWSYLEARQTPMMREVEIFPARITEAGEVMELGERLPDSRVPERLALEPHYPLQYAQVSQRDAALKADGQFAAVRSAPYRPGDPPQKGMRSPYLIIDFGRQVFGFPKVRLRGPAGGVVEMTYGSELVAGRTAALLGGVRYGDRYVMRAGDQSWQLFEYKQFRYLEIVFRNVDTGVQVDSVSLVSYDYPAERKGRFECSDSILTRLWKACIDTTYLHMEDTLVCDATRERRAWTGDGAHGLYGIYPAFGDVAITDWFFRLIARGALADGMLRMYYPGSEPPVGGSNRVNWSITFESPEHAPATAFENPVNIPQFALFYGMLVGEHYRFFGKRALMEELYPALAGLAGWSQRHADDTGLLYNLPNWNFVDWTPTDMVGANFETNALYCQMLEDFSRIAADLERPRDAARWRSEAEKVRGSLRQLHWNANKQLFVDSVAEGKQSSTITEVANGMALLYGIAAKEQIPLIVRNLAHPPNYLVISSPLYFYYVVDGLMKAGAADVALTLMRERHVAMMEASDAPSMWEFWSPYVRARNDHYSGQIAAPVHSGSVGPAWTLSKYVLGVEPDGPGFQRCRIAPQPGWLQWARGVFPTVRGDIHVSWKKDGNAFSMDTELPKALAADIVLPRQPGGHLLLTWNEKTYDLSGESAMLPGVRVSESAVTVPVTGGRHRITLERR